MSDPTLSEEQKMAVGKWLEPLKKFMQQKEGKEFFANRESRTKRYAEALAPDKIDKLTEAELSDLIGDLWANEMWSDKSQPLSRILTGMSFDQFKQELKRLLWDADGLPARYDRVRTAVKGMGPSMITELLTVVNPNGAIIWNRRARQALAKLKMNNVMPTSKYDITGTEYVKIVEAVKPLKEYLASVDLPFKPHNLLDLDYLLHFISTHDVANAPSAVSPDHGLSTEAEPNYDFDHNEVRDTINELGIGLGFESEIEVPVAKGAKVDVLWKSKIGNLGVVKYVFEVHKNGSIDSLILNLQKARASDPSVQRLISVSNTENIESIREEISGLSEEFKKSVAFMEAKDALRAAELMKEAKEILDRLELVKSG